MALTRPPSKLMPVDTVKDITTNAVNIAKTHFEIDSYMGGQKHSLNNMVIDVLNDNTGVDASKSSYVFDSALKQAKTSSITDTDTTQADFQAGTLTDVVAGVGGDVTLQNGTDLNQTDTLKADFATGTNLGVVADNKDALMLYVNKALNFNGSNSYVAFTQTTPFQVANISLECWFRTTSTANMALVRWRTYGYGLILSGGMLSFSFYDSATTEYKVSTSFSVSDGMWHHACGTYDGANVKFYVDGIFIGQLATTATMYYGAGAFAFGRDGDTNVMMFNGDIDEVRLWNQARTQSAIQSTMYSRLTGQESGLIGCWCLDDGFGTVAIDKSNNKLNGTLNNNTWVEATWDKTYFTRSTPAWTKDVKRVDSGLPRRESGKFGNSIRIEEGTTNLATYSEQFGSWTAGGTNPATITSNTDYSPAGTLTADTIADNSTAGYNWQYQTLTVANDSNWHTFSLYVKKRTSVSTNIPSFDLVYSGGTATRVAIAFDPYTGVATRTKDDTNNGSPGTYLVEDIDSNWWRVSISCPNNGTANTSLIPRIYPVLFINATDATNGITADSSTGSTVVWGAQVEKKKISTTYVETPSSATITRNPEYTTIPPYGKFGNNIGTIEMWVKPEYNSTGGNQINYFFYHGYNSSNPVTLGRKIVDGKLVAGYGNSASLVTSTSSIPLGSWSHIAMKWTGMTVTLYINGVASGNTTATVDSIVGGPLYIGSGNAADQQMNGLIGDIRLSNIARSTSEILANYNSTGPMQVDANTTYKNSFNGLFEGSRTASTNINSVSSVNTSTVSWSTVETKRGLFINKDTSGTAYVKIPDNANLRGFTAGITVEYWYKRTDYSNELPMVCKVPSAGTGDYNIQNSGATRKIQFVAKTTAGVISKIFDAQFDDSGRWAHVACTFDGTNWRVYTNGVLQQTIVDARTLQLDATSDLCFGAYSAGNIPCPILGLRDVRIWSVARTASEIADNMNKTLVGNETNLKGYWKLDQTSGTTANDSVGTNHGTLFNGPVWLSSYIPTEMTVAKFDGTTSYGTASGLPALADNLTIEFKMMFNKDNVAVFQLFDSGDVNRNKFQFATADGLSVFAYNTTAGNSARILVTHKRLKDNTEHHIAFVQTGTSANATIYGYLDGELVSTISGVTGIQTTGTTTALFGKRTDNVEYSDITVRDVRIWNVAKTQNQIQTSMHSNLTGSETNLVALWKFDEGSGVIAKDYTASARHATLVNTKWGISKVKVDVSIDSGATWATVTNGGTLLTGGTSTTGKTLLSRQTLIANELTNVYTPTLYDITYNITASVKTSGNLISGAIDLNAIKYATGGTIAWTASTPTNTAIAMETRLSTDGGSTWGSWTSVTNGGSVSQITNGADLTNNKLQYRASLTTSVPPTVPTLNDVTVTVNGNGTVVWLSDTANAVPTNAWITADATGTIQYYISRDGGTTFTLLTPDTMTDITGQPSGTSVVAKAVLGSVNAVVRALAWGWK